MAFPEQKILLLAGVGLVVTIGTAVSQGPGRSRQHTATVAKPVQLVPANEDPPSRNRVQISVNGSSRQVHANGIPDHNVGSFPNRSNPNRISEQRNDFEFPANPQQASRITPLREAGGPFGVALNGVQFEPGTAEFWQGDPGSGWNYEALGGAVPLGLDTNFAHVQPTGNYHYHGTPTLLMKRLGYREGDHSPQIGWAADGFPIYVKWGYSDPKSAQSEISELRSSYRLKDGQRPGGSEPSGTYDGAFTQDYEYVPGLGDLDECNGRFCVTPEFPDGTYAYFLTENWPVIPRYFKGTPTAMRSRMGPGGMPPGGPGGAGGPGDRRGPKGPPPGGGFGRKGPPLPPR